MPPFRPASARDILVVVPEIWGIPLLLVRAKTTGTVQAPSMVATLPFPRANGLVRLRRSMHHVGKRARGGRYARAAMASSYSPTASLPVDPLAAQLGERFHT